MGGKGSGGINRLSDEERKKRGTHRPWQGDDVLDDRNAKRVVKGPWLSAIPEPDFPLSELGRTKYDELSAELFAQHKLTKITVTLASIAAMMHQKFHHLATIGKHPSGHDVAKYQSVLRDMKIADNAKVTASPDAKNKFAGVGFANSRATPFRLRPHTRSGAGEL